jgi:hypothetical protein
MICPDVSQIIRNQAFEQMLIEWVCSSALMGFVLGPQMLMPIASLGGSWSKL